MESVGSPGAVVIFLQVVWFPPTIRKHAVRLTGDSKLAVGVTVGE